MKSNGISFIIPAYNAERTLSEAALSIINGNFNKGDEIVIVEDCSTDRTMQVAQELTKKNPAVTLLKNDKNKGCPSSRNKGIEAASNSLIFNLDADDVLISGSVKKLRDFMEKNKADVAAFSEIHFFKDGDKTITHKWICPTGVLSLADYLSGFIVPGGNYLYTKKSWLKIGKYWEFGRGLHEFWGFSLKQIASGSKFVSMPDSHYLHRYGTNSLFIRESKKDELVSEMATKMISPFLKQLNKEDQNYITGKGKSIWFTNIKNRPIRVKSGETGRAGIIVNTTKKSSTLSPILGAALAGQKFLTGQFKFRSDYKKFLIKSDERFKLINKEAHLFDHKGTHEIDRHYIYHPAWAARILAKTHPKNHTDISSILAFSTISSAFIPTKFYDYRPANLRLSNFSSEAADLTKLPFPSNSLESLSCMHVIEHIGLGRYGDHIDPQGDLKAIKELKRVVKKNGQLLFVVPIGQPLIKFNAHRIYSYSQILKLFHGWSLSEFSLIPDNPKSPGIVYQASQKMADLQSYGCGCFWFIKK